VPGDRIGRLARDPDDGLEIAGVRMLGVRGEDRARQVPGILNIDACRSRLIEQARLALLGTPIMTQRLMADLLSLVTIILL
jgi:hypothetical protein